MLAAVAALNFATTAFLATAALFATTAFFESTAFADGMIVPVRPEIRVSGNWAVKYHHVSINVIDQVASVNIDQEFVNLGSGMIEVEYLFPVPPEAAIDSMTLVVNGKELAARLLPSKEARTIYEEIVRKKKDPALLEYVGYGLVKTSAFPLEPNKPAHVIVTYKTVCKKDNNLVQVWYPLNTEKFSAKAVEDVQVRVDVASKADITAVYSPTHDLKVERKDPRHVVATYQAANTLPTADFQLFYKEADEAVGATVLTYQPKTGEDGYFLMLVSPNPHAGRQTVIAKDVVAVIDHSGSMSGEKMSQVKDALRSILKSLNVEDRFNVIAYNDTVDPFFDSLQEANKANVEKALDQVDRIEASGVTNLHDAVVNGMKMFHGGNGKDRPGYLIFLTDGLPTVGVTNEGDIVRDATKANERNVHLFTFGVGYDVNVRLLDKLVAANGGKSDYVKPKENVEGKIASLYNKIKNPIMTDLQVRLEGLDLRDTYPRAVGDLFDGDQILLVGRYNGSQVSALKGDKDGNFYTQLVVTGKYEGAERGFEYPVTIRPGNRETAYAFVEKLWAVRRVGWLLDQIQLSGENKEVVDELVRLSKDYGIMTPYTSFLADESVAMYKPADVHAYAAKAASGLRSDIDGAAGQVNAMNRQAANEAVTVAQPSAPAASLPAGVNMSKEELAVRGSATGANQIGYSGTADYERKKVQNFQNVRNVGNQAVYRRGQQWVASNATQLDPVKDAQKIKTVQRFSDEYFELAKANSTAENQVLATQQDGEELMIELRGQAYLIK
jgi:Ca-activated chloride channel family protein